MRADPPQFQPGTPFGPYRIDGPVGAGGMGQVYRATDTRLRRTVAIKVLPAALRGDAEFDARLEREAQVLASLNHPNIGAIHGLERADDVTGLVLEFVEGPTVAEALSRGRLPLREALDTAKQIALALEAAHEKGIVHRDLKPANIKLAPGGVVKVLDFGIARVSDGSAGPMMTTAFSTRTGMILGTPAYMSPEQARGGDVDKRADVWAFGCVLFEMLTGHGPFEAMTASDSLAKVIERDPNWQTLPSEVPEPIRRLLARCLQKDPAARLRGMADARLEISETLDTPTSRSGPSTNVANGFLRDWRTWAAGAVVVAAVSGYFVWRGRQAMPADARGVVALPAQVLGAQELGYLTDAIPSTLSTQLGQVAGLDIRVPPTSLEFETIHRKLDTIGDLYKVAMCIVSTITVDADHFVLNVQLVEPRSGTIRFAQRFEGQRGSYLELARQAADWVRQKLAPTAALGGTGNGPTANSEAELAMREGTYFLNSFNNRHEPAHFGLAVAAFQRAFTLDPGLAEAVAQIAFLHRFRWEADQEPTDEAIANIVRFAQQALKVSPACGRAWAALFWSEQMRPSPDYAKQLEYGLKSASFGGQDALVQTSLGASISSASAALALPAFAESRRLDPLYVYAYFNATSALLQLGRYTEGESLAEDGLKIEPALPFGLLQKLWSVIDLGKKGDAVELLQQQSKALSDPMSLYVLAAEQGDAKSAAARLDRVLKFIEGAETYSLGRRQGANRLLPYLISHGQADLAMQVLSRVTELGDTPNYDTLMLNRRYDPVRSDPRFTAALAQSRARFDGLLTALAAARTRGHLPRYLDDALVGLRAELGIK